MSGTEPRRGFPGYLRFLAMCVLLPLLWVRCLAFARENSDRDGRAGAKMAMAIGASLVLFGGAVLATQSFVDDAAAGYYASLDGRLSLATGEADYQSQVEAVRSRDASIPIIERNLAAARETGDAKKISDLEVNLNKTRTERTDAQARMQELEGNHALYRRIAPMVREGPGAIGLVPTDSFPADARIREEIKRARDGGLDYEGEQEGRVRTMDEGVARAFAIKDRAVDDMYGVLVWLVYPGLLGLLFAPLVWLMGRMLRANYVPSDSVGFKPYPSGAAAWTLLLGAFGVPAVFYAAWVLQDLNNRAAEGQINL